MSTQSHNKTFFDMFKNMNVPSVDFEAAMETHRKNLETLQAAQRATFETIKNVSQTHMNFLKDSVNDFKTHVKDVMSSKSFEDKIQSHSNRVKESLEKASHHGRHLAEMIQNSSKDIHQTMSQRMNDCVKETKSWHKTATVNKTAH